MKKLILKSCTALALIMGGLISQSALADNGAIVHAQTQNWAYHNCGSPNIAHCQSTYQGAVIHIPNQEWINYYGALAWDLKSGSTGISENARSERAAKREALQKCGTKDCEIAAHTRNGCLAAAYDGKGSGVGAGDTKEQAEQRAINHCQADVGSTCVINYSHCNYPVRIK